MKKLRKKTIPEKIGKRYFEVFDPVFGRRINVLLNYSPDDFEGWLNRNKIKDVGTKTFNDFAGMTMEIESKDGETEILVWLRNFDWAIKCQGTLIHEITHAVVRVFNHNNIPFTTETQEFFAHMIARIYEDIARKLLVWTK